MAVKSYSVAKSGNVQLSANFRVREFQSKDGADTVLISDELTEVLGMADRIFVVKTGKAVKEIMRGPDFSEETVIEVMI